MRLTTKRLIFLAYFLVIFILYQLSSFFPGPEFWTKALSFNFLRYSFRELILWFAGAFLGAYFIKLEQIFYVYFTHPEEALSVEVKNLINQKRKKEVWQLLRQRVGEQKLAFRSALFQVIWVVLAFFVLTSTSSVFGKTLVMAIGLYLLLKEWEAMLDKKEINWLFWQVKRVIAPKEQKIFLWGMTGIFAVLSLLLI